MAIPRNRIRTDPRDGTEWELVYEPPVEEDEPEVRRYRAGIRFLSRHTELKVPAVFGSDLHTLSDADLQGCSIKPGKPPDRDGRDSGRVSEQLVSRVRSSLRHTNASAFLMRDARASPADGRAPRLPSASARGTGSG